MEYMIIEKGNPLAIHSVGYFGESGRIIAQERVDSGYCSRYGWANGKGGYDYDTKFEVVEVKEKKI